MDRCLQKDTQPCPPLEPLARDELHGAIRTEAGFLQDHGLKTPSALSAEEGGWSAPRSLGARCAGGAGLAPAPDWTCLNTKRTIRH